MNYLRSMPFTIVFIDKKGNTFEDSCRDLNATFKQKHHGNAILSRLPIITQNNLNITVNRLEKRGVLHC